MWLSELGMYFYKNRAYSPTLGRFLQTDPIGYGGDGPNLYAYVSNDPVNLVDPLGLAMKCVFDGIWSCTSTSPESVHGYDLPRNAGPVERRDGNQSADSKPQNNCPTPARLSSLDGFIDGAVGAFNGSADAGPVPLPADLIKAMVAVESGYNRSAYINDPMQVNVPGDWVARKAEWGLVRGSAPGQAVGIVAGIGWLSYKAFRYDSSGNRASFLGWEAAAVRYNGGGDPNYLSKIRAARARINQGC
jgi:RHS repeat-associated protein